jgi:hypothetical protein
MAMIHRCCDVMFQSVQFAELDHHRPRNDTQQHQRKEADPEGKAVAGGKTHMG